jgi:hypothetical protein
LRKFTYLLTSPIAPIATIGHGWKASAFICSARFSASEKRRHVPAEALLVRDRVAVDGLERPLAVDLLELGAVDLRAVLGPA